MAVAIGQAQTQRARAQRGRPRRDGPIEQPGLFGIRRMNRTRLVIGIILAVVSLFPLLYMLSLSFQPNAGILGSTALIPTHPTGSNYVQAWSENSFGHYFFNSLFVALATVVITVAFACLAAFAFARYDFPLKEVIFYLFLASLAVPGLLLLIPQYLLLDRIHLLDSLVGLTLLYVSANLPFSIFFLRGFFQGIPRDLEEAFRLEGASTLRVIRSLIVPLSVPAIAVVSIFIFNAAWDEFPAATTFLNSPSHFTLPVGLADFIGNHTTAWGPLFAASVIATVPTIIVFVLALRWFRSGVSLGGLR
ncbi:MAG TPA: carbohydrate ABC transporter permease [Acidimicrobiales bacterium]|nr:carbohydrate ABC transporter permease [Acidimicrobiales bacterium]